MGAAGTGRDGTGRGEDARSFDSTAFLRIRQTFDSFTWEPRNSSWWLSSFPFSPFLSTFSPSFGFMERVWVSGTRFVAIDAPSICPLQNLVSAVFLTFTDQSCLATLSFFVDSAIAVNILCGMFFARHVVLLPESL